VTILLDHEVDILIYTVDTICCYCSCLPITTIPMLPPACYLWLLRWCAGYNTSLNLANFKFKYCSSSTTIFHRADPRGPKTVPFAVAQLVFHTSLPSGRLEHCLPLRRVTLHIMVKQTPSLSNSNHLNGCQKSE